MTLLQSTPLPKTFINNTHRLVPCPNGVSSTEHFATSDQGPLLAEQQGLLPILEVLEYIGQLPLSYV